MIYRVFMTDEDYVVIDADSPEEAMLKLRDAGLEPVKAEPFDAHARRSKGAAPARKLALNLASSPPSKRALGPSNNSLAGSDKSAGAMYSARTGQARLGNIPG